MGDGDEDPTVGATDDYNDEDFEESASGVNHLLGFMFGNVDDSGDLDADYLDEDAKEHLFALADKLRPSLEDIDLSKYFSAPTDPSEKGLEDKACNAVDYEDIDEEYDGLEVEATTEEDNMLSKNDFPSSNLVCALVNSTVSVFDEENYDDVDDEELPNAVEFPVNNVLQDCSSGKTGTEEGQVRSKSETSLPALYLEEGSVILRFGEIFGIQEPVRKVKTYHHKRQTNKELQLMDVSDTVEEDEELFLRSTVRTFQTNEYFAEIDSGDSVSVETFRLRDSCLSEQPMKLSDEDIAIAQRSLICSDFYPIDHENWENYIIWDNSAADESQPSLKCCVISDKSMDVHSDRHTKDYDHGSRCHDALSVPFGFAEIPTSANNHSPVNCYDPSIKETGATQKKNTLDHAGRNVRDGAVKSDTMLCLNNLCSMNRELLEGSWWDDIIWDSSEDAPKPKLIFDLKDDRMLFEILDGKNMDHLCSHARATIVVSRPMKTSVPTVENFDNHPIKSCGQFNICNDKFYSNWKLSQQATSLGIKVVHSDPANKLQTMKEKLSIDTEANSDLDSFAGDLEKLLGGKEFGGENAGKGELTNDKTEKMRGLQMRSFPTRAHLNDQIEDNEKDAVLERKLPEEDCSDTNAKKQPVGMATTGAFRYNRGVNKTKQSGIGEMIKSSGHAGALARKENTPKEAKEDRRSFAEGGLSSRLQTKKTFDGNDILLGTDTFEEKRQGGRTNNLICGACGQLGHMRTNKLCPKYGKSPETSEMDVMTSMQIKTPNKKLVSKVLSEVPETEGSEFTESTKSVPEKLKCGEPDKPLERNMSPSGPLVSDKHIIGVKDVTSSGKNILYNKMKYDYYPSDTTKPSVVFGPPAELGKDVPHRKITIKQPKVLVNQNQQRHAEHRSDQEITRQKRKIVESSSSEKRNREDNYWFAGEPDRMNSSHERSLSLQTKRTCIKGIMLNDESWRTLQAKREIQGHRLIRATVCETREEELWKSQTRIKTNNFRCDDLFDHKSYMNDRRAPERHIATKRSTQADTIKFTPSVKRRRGGEVDLSNILQKIVDHLRGSTTISYMFLKPVRKKDAPDYLDVIERPMDIGTIRDKVRKMEYRNRKEFRHDVAQIAVNAHRYNDNRHPGIPPLADELLKMCDHLLEESSEMLDDAECAMGD